MMEFKKQNEYKVEKAKKYYGTIVRNILQYPNNTYIHT